MVCCNKGRFNVELCANVSKDLIFKLRATVAENTRSRVRTNQVRNNGIGDSLGRLVRQWCKNHETAEVVDTDKDVDRALVAAQQLEKVYTNNVKGFSSQRIWENKSRFGGTLSLCTRDAL